MERGGWRKLLQVICHTSSREDERPVKFRIEADWIQIERVLSAWLERGAGQDDPVWRVFEVESELGRVYLRVAVDGWVWEYHPA